MVILPYMTLRKCSNACTGINLVLVCSCPFVLAKGKKRAEIKMGFVVVVVFQFLLSTTSAGLGLTVNDNIFTLR
jgi:hypothetical protein